MACLQTVSDRSQAVGEVVGRPTLLGRADAVMLDRQQLQQRRTTEASLRRHGNICFQVWWLGGGGLDAGLGCWDDAPVTPADPGANRGGAKSRINHALTQIHSPNTWASTGISDGSDDEANEMP